ncbi:MAG: 50S ribosomal protein L29 [Deltaproteobacteria bacterium]|nr:50S ribosomal protein L29 [Deltaproteobacteria bacterium]
MRAKEMRERSDEELGRMLDDARDQLFQFRIQNATHQLDNTSKIPATRREMARINTILGERRLAGQPVSEEAKGDEE